MFYPNEWMKTLKFYCSKRLSTNFFVTSQHQLLPRFENLHNDNSNNDDNDSDNINNNDGNDEDDKNNSYNSPKPGFINNKKS